MLPFGNYSTAANWQQLGVGQLEGNEMVAFDNVATNVFRHARIDDELMELVHTA